MEQTHLMFDPKQSIIVYDFAIYSKKKSDDDDAGSAKRIQVNLPEKNKKDGVVETNHG